MTASCGRTNNSCLPGYAFINRGQRLEKAENLDLIKFILKDLEQDPQYEKKKGVLLGLFVDSVLTRSSPLLAIKGRCIMLVF